MSKNSDFVPICPCGSRKALVNFRMLLDHNWENIDSQWAVKCEDCGQDVLRSLAEIIHGTPSQKQAIHHTASTSAAIRQKLI